MTTYICALYKHGVHYVNGICYGFILHHLWTGLEASQTFTMGPLYLRHDPNCLCGCTPCTNSEIGTDHESNPAGPAALLTWAYHFKHFANNASSFDISLYYGFRINE